MDYSIVWHVARRKTVGAYSLVIRGNHVYKDIQLEDTPVLNIKW